MNPFKIIVNPKESEMIQKLLFLAGYTWASGDTTPKFFDHKRLVFYTKLNILCENERCKYPTITFKQFLDEIEIELNNK